MVWRAGWLQAYGLTPSTHADGVGVTCHHSPCPSAHNHVGCVGVVCAPHRGLRHRLRQKGVGGGGVVLATVKVSIQCVGADAKDVLDLGTVVFLWVGGSRGGWGGGGRQGARGTPLSTSHSVGWVGRWHRLTDMGGGRADGCVAAGVSAVRRHLLDNLGCNHVAAKTVHYPDAKWGVVRHGR